MPQLHLPLFPSGATAITAALSFCAQDSMVTYFHCGMPVFSHEKEDRASFRLITAQLHVTSGTPQAELARAFGVSKISIKRAVKLYRSNGAAGFFAARAVRGAAVLTAPVLLQAQSQLDAGQASRTVAALLGIKDNTFTKAMQAGRLRAPPKKAPPPAPR